MIDLQSATNITSQVKNGKITALQVVEDCLARLESQKHLNAFLHVDAQGALATAVEIDRKLANNIDLGRLAGVPVAIKDNICVKGMPCTAGSKILEGFYPPYDATCVTKLREAGAIIIGKTNLDEFGMGSSGENSAYGSTLNPLDNSRVTGGSSSGSAAAVAAGIVPLALGTDTGGSVRQPAAFCGIVGLKATYGRISRYGLISYASSLDHVAIFGRSIADVKLGLSVCCGKDRHDMTSLEGSLSDKLIPVNINGLKVGIWAECMGEGVAPEVATAFSNAQRILSKAGAELIITSLPLTKFTLAAYYIAATAEASSNLARYDGVLYGQRMDTEEGILEMFRQTRGHLFGTEVKRRILLGTFVLSLGYQEKYYATALRLAKALESQLSEAFQNVDFILGLTSPTPAFQLGEIMNPLQMYLSDVFTCPANMAGIPSISIPVPVGNGLSAGLQLMVKHDAEEKLLAIAEEITQLLN